MIILQMQAKYYALFRVGYVFGPRWKRWREGSKAGVSEEEIE
jgi:hypothetical protein